MRPSWLRLLWKTGEVEHPVKSLVQTSAGYPSQFPITFLSILIVNAGTDDFGIPADTLDILAWSNVRSLGSKITNTRRRGQADIQIHSLVQDKKDDPRSHAKLHEKGPCFVTLCVTSEIVKPKHRA